MKKAWMGEKSAISSYLHIFCIKGILQNPLSIPAMFATMKLVAGMERGLSEQ